MLSPRTVFALTLLGLAACGVNDPAPTGSGGGASTGGASGAAVKDPSAYAHNTPNAAHPYPQNKLLANCTYPAYKTDAIATAYTNWKSAFFQGNRVIRPDSGNDTVSEGIAYGMLIGVYMNDKAMFDALWGFAQSKFDSKGLMNWHIDANGAAVGQGSAIDADEDMAWALLMAARQWGGNYQTDAVSMIEKIWVNGVDPAGVLKPGDNFGGSGETNPSYFAPSYYRVFARVTSRPWMTVVDTSYATLAAASGSFGLVPNWTNAAGAPVTGPAGDGNGAFYGYDACRTPWRIAVDFCQSGDARAKAYLDKVTAFFASRAPSNLTTLKDGYTANGDDPPTTLGNYTAGMAMYGPAGTAALSGTQPAFLSLTYSGLEAYTARLSGSFTYYHASWGVLSLLAMSGNFWDMTQ